MMLILSSQSPTEHARQLKAMRAMGRQIARKPETARAFLIEAGFITPSGRLAKRYR